MERDPNHTSFWNIADDYIMAGEVEEGTMMGHHCLRAVPGGQFVATVDRSSGVLIVKLPVERVNELIRNGHGAAFAPAGRVFKEWVEVPDQGRWAVLIDESIAFVG